MYLHARLVPSCWMIWLHARDVVRSALSVLDWLLIVLSVLDHFGIIIIVFLNVQIAIMLIRRILASSVRVILMLVLSRL